MSAPPLLELFLELCSIRSPPGEERPVADRVEAYLDAIGIPWHEDGTGPSIGSTMGTIVARVAATAPGTPIFLCAHLDTVPVEGEIEPVVEDGVVRTHTASILGADNKAAVAVMLDAARRVIEEERPHAGIELVFTPLEEVGLTGVEAFDQSVLQAELGFVYDHAAPIGLIVEGAPTGAKFEAVFHGRAAHGGMAPEEGRSAVVAAARAIADLPLGRIDEITTANLGVIEGGTARNVVPEFCRIEGDARSHDPARLARVLQEHTEVIAYAAATSHCTVDTTITTMYSGYRLDRQSPVLQLAASGLRAAGVEPQFGLSGGGADTNVFNARGLPCVTLANGMAEIHTPGEHIAVSDLELMVEVTLGIVDAARAH